MLVLMAGAGDVCAQSSWTPFTAIYRMTNEQRRPDGNSTVVEEQRGRYYRSSNGSDLKLVDRFAGTVDDGPLRGTLRDAKSQATFDLDFTAHLATLTQRWGTGGRRRLHTPANAGATEIVNGVTCVDVPMRGPLIKVGKGCLSLALDLIVKLDWETVPNPDGTWHHIVEQYSNIQIGKEPDLGLFAIPTGFRLVER